MTTYLIIDDEHIAHTIIKGYCDLLPNMTLAKHCYDALEALDYLRSHQVDLIFLDLNMPKLKGFEFLRILPQPPKVIVTTAYKEYALEGFELNIIDYLLKPFSFERFLKAINKAIDFKSDPNGLISPHIKEQQHIFLYSDKKHRQVKVDDILFIKADGNYCQVMLSEGHILVRQKLSDILESLSSQKFIQVHKSFILAKKHIHSIEGNRVTIKNHQIPIGKLYKANVLNFLKH